MEITTKVMSLVTALSLGSAAPAAAVERLYVTSSVADVVTVIDVAQRQVIDEIPVPPSPDAIAPSPDGTRVYLTTDDGLAIIDTASNEIASTLDLVAHAHVVSVSPDGARLYVATTASAFYAIDAESLAVTTVPLDSAADRILPSADGALLYATRATQFTIYDARTLQRVRDVHLAGAGTLAVDPAGGELASFTRSELVEPAIVFSNPVSGTPMRSVPYGGPRAALQYEPSGSSLIASDPEHIALVAPGTGDTLRSLGTSGGRDVAADEEGLLYSLSNSYSAVLVFDPSDTEVDSPLLAAIPVRPSVEHLTVADVPSTSSDGGCHVGAPSPTSAPWCGLGALLAASALARARFGRAKGPTDRMDRSGGSGPRGSAPDSTTQQVAATSRRTTRSFRSSPGTNRFSCRQPPPELLAQPFLDVPMNAPKTRRCSRRGPRSRTASGSRCLSARVVVAHAERPPRTRLISARRAPPKERRTYEEAH